MYKPFNVFLQVIILTTCSAIEAQEPSNINQPSNKNNVKMVIEEEKKHEEKKYEEKKHEEKKNVVGENAKQKDIIEDKITVPRLDQGGKRSIKILIKQIKGMKF